MDEIVLPPRMFAAGDEPVGERVNSYHKIKTTRSIIAALEPEELEFLSNSTFGRILAIDDNPPFSGAFGQHFCTVETAIDMLENKVVKTRELRIKIACLAITSSILFPSSHTPRIIPEHVELIRDLDEFLAFPWGRASYLTLASSIKGKDEIALSQTSVAIRGYVEAIQLIMLAAIPELKEEVTQSERVVIVDTESDGESNIGAEASEDVNVAGQVKPPQATKYCLIPGHAKTADSECKVFVKSILDDPYEEWSAGLDFSWADESDDLALDHMVLLISEGFVFRKEMFKGGLTANDLSRMRGEKKLKEKEPKDKNDKDHVAEVSEGEGSSDFVDMIRSMENRIYQALDAKFEKLVSPTSQSQHAALLQSTVSRCLQDIDKKIGDSLARQLKDMQASIIKGVIDVLGQPSSTQAGLVGNTSNSKEPPVFDFTTQSEAADSRINNVLRDLNVVVDVSHPVTIEGSLEPQNQQVPDADDSQPQAEEHIEEQLHDSAPMDQSEQQIDANTETELSEQQVDANTKSVQEVTGQPAVELPSFSLGLTQEGSTVGKESDHPTNYVSAPMEHDEEAGAQRKSKRAKITPVGLQDYKCDPKVTSVQAIIPDLDQRFQLIEEKLQNEAKVLLHGGYALTPAEFCDIAHRQSILPSGIVDALIGIVNRGSAANPKVAIYDTSLPVAIMEHHNRFVKTAVKDRVKLKFSNIPLEFTPIANLIPYVLKHVGYTEANAVIKPFTVSRCKGIPQITANTDAAVMTVLFIEAHAVDGLVGCKAVSTRLLPVASKQLAVKLWDYISA
ncbi:hypothetical protein Rs2_49843 [Raphanus sativus]|nr:hypothetical protein Rs2_49843 [Raphanus sativus]